MKRCKIMRSAAAAPTIFQPVTWLCLALLGWGGESRAYQSRSENSRSEERKAEERKAELGANYWVSNHGSPAAAKLN